MSRRRRRVAAAVTSVLVAMLIGWLLLGAWMAAQMRAVDVLATTLGRPSLLVWVVDRTTPSPQSSQLVIDGAPATVVHPSGTGPWPAIVFVNGATQQGREEPHVVRLGLGLARAGFLVVVPDLPGLRQGEIGSDTVATLVAVCSTVAHERDARGARVGLLGVSVGASLALLASESPALAGHVSAVAGLAPYTSLRDMLMLATTGSYPLDGRFVRYQTGSFLALALARSLAGSLPASPSQRALVSALLAVRESSPDPLANLPTPPAGRAGAPERSAEALLRNRSPARFAELWGGLPAPLRQAAAALSPITGAARLRFPVYLASSPHDEYFPPSQSSLLVERAPDARLTVTETLDHVLPEPSPSHLTALAGFDGFVVTALRSLRDCASPTGCATA